jgi:hypothetical protein
MTVQPQERTAGTAPPATPAVALPEQRRADHDAQATVTAPAAPHGWSTVADRTACRWMCVAMPALGLYASLMVWLSARVW